MVCQEQPWVVCKAIPHVFSAFLSPPLSFSESFEASKQIDLVTHAILSKAQERGKKITLWGTHAVYEQM